MSWGRIPRKKSFGLKNVKGPVVAARRLHLCEQTVSQIKQQGGGVIINVSSVAGLQAWAGTGTYSASKHGIMALTKSLADEGQQITSQSARSVQGAVADKLVDASPADIERSEKIDPFDVTEAIVHLSSLREVRRSAPDRH